MVIVLVICIVVLGVLIAITATAYAQTKVMSKITLSQSSLQEPPAGDDDWANTNQFNFVGNYQTKLGIVQALISAWGHTERPTFLCKYTLASQGKTKCTYDIVTKFDDEVSLTTGCTKDGQMHPRPKCFYMQSFSDFNLDSLWRKHIQMENYLMDQGGASLIGQNLDFETYFTESIRKHADFIQSIPLWYLRSVWWFLVRRHIWHDRTIEKQHKLRMIKLPNELSNINTLSA